VTAELPGQQLELLKEALPTVSRVTVLHHMRTGYPFFTGAKDVAATAERLHLTLLSAAAERPDRLEEAFASLTRERAEALVVQETAMNWAYRHLILELAAKHRVPTVYANGDYVEAGGLMSYGVNLRENDRRAAEYVDRIRKGAKPADLPVAPPPTFKLVINLKTAKALGLTIPPSILLRADEVIR
jgi:putative ABC transport system substrate-binding protein